MLTIKDLAVRRGARPLVRDVSLTCAAGERVALLGASGSGKSLTARALLGLLPPGLAATGSIRLHDTEVLGVPGARRARPQRPGAVLQDSALALHPLVRVEDQVALPLAPASRAARRHEARELLAAVGLPGLGDRYPGELSGGQRQRVCLALALACRPSLLVADEPTTALDVVTQAAIVTLLAERTGNAALLFITHDLAVAAALCTRAVVLHEGAVVEDRPIADLLHAPAHPRTRALVAAARAADAVLP